jgi:F-type H+-transporting ATPase subunit b
MRLLRSFFGVSALALAVVQSLAVQALAAEESSVDVLDAHAERFPPFDGRTFSGQLFWLAIAFGSLYWLMSRIALPRIGGIIEERRAKIAADLDTATLMQKKAADAQSDYEMALAKAKANAQTIAQQAKDAANKQAEAKRHAVESELSSKIAASEASISAATQAAMSNVGSIATEAANAIVQRLTGITPAADELKSAVEASIKV